MSFFAKRFILDAWQGHEYVIAACLSCNLSTFITTELSNVKNICFTYGRFFCNATI